MQRISDTRTARWPGYTLVELMVVMAIIMITASVAVANLPRMKLDQRIARTARVYAGLVREARGRSIANRVYTRVTATTGINGTIQIMQRRCNWGVLDPDAGDCALCPTGATCVSDWEVIRTIRMGSEDFSRVMIASVPNSGSITWSPRGLPHSSGNGFGMYVFREAGDAAGVRAQTWGCRVTASGQVEVR